MKIKIFALALALLLCALPLVACTEGAVDTSSAYEVYSHAASMLKDCERYEKHITMTLSQGEVGKEERMISTSIVKSSDENYALDLSVDFYGAGGKTPEQNMKLAFLYKDATLYYTAPAGKYMGECDNETFNSFVVATATSFYPFRSNLPNFTDDDLKGVGVTENADGTRSFTVSVRGDKVAYLTESFRASSDNIVFQNTTVTLTFDQKNAPLLLRVSFDSVVDGNLAGNFLFEIEYINIGTSPAINPPSDTSDYKPTDFKALMEN